MKIGKEYKEYVVTKTVWHEGKTHIVTAYYKTKEEAETIMKSWDVGAIDSDGARIVAIKITERRC